MGAAYKLPTIRRPNVCIPENRGNMPAMSTRQKATLTVGEQLSTYLGHLLEEKRTKADPYISRAKIARLLVVTEQTVERLELKPGLPPDVDRYVAGYARLLGIDDPRDIYLEAIDRWKKHGPRPRVSADEPLQRDPGDRSKDLAEAAGLIEEAADEQGSSDLGRRLLG